MRQRYICWNAASVSTSVLAGASVTAGSVKTQLQLTAPSTGQLELVGWGVSFNGSGLASPLQAELVGTGTIAGGSPTAVTPYPYGDPNAPASNATAGFTPTSEGSIVASRLFDSEFVQDVTPYFYQFPLGERPIIAVSNVVRVRVWAPSGSTVTCLAYIIWAE